MNRTGIDSINTGYYNDNNLLGSTRKISGSTEYQSENIESGKNTFSSSLNEKMAKKSSDAANSLTNVYGVTDNEKNSQGANCEKTNNMKTNNANAHNDDEAYNMDLMQIIKDRILQMQENIENGNTEPTFQIGNKSYTIKEWNTLVESIDKSIDSIKEEQKERFEKLKEELEEKEQQIKKLFEERNNKVE